ncbi:methyltransferase domain-containing protein [Candidatus Leptofilum sp.]|uniref:methyltransferase domain-containing protein n=1 Tax=Candidatus Leptofilum sp. TaxID=3241576 RepID=UPI003B5BFDB0
MILKENNPKIAPLLLKHIDMLACPKCCSNLEASGTHLELICVQCKHQFTITDGIPQLFWPNEWDGKTDVTEEMKAFYEENPFPSYDNLDSKGSLRTKAEKGIFARLLDDQIPHGSKVLEVGCGTGQLSNFLGMKWGRTVFGADLCLNSLRLGQGFREKNQIDNAFLQMNLFKPAFKEGSFDFVICNGVLHHTSDPFQGYRSISRLVKKGGFILIGLYHMHSRIPTDIRRFIFNMSGDRFKFLDPRLRNQDIDDHRKHIWFMDQYKNPHESKHTFGEVQKWFDQTGFDFVNSIPKSKAFESFSTNEELFETNPRGTIFDHFIVQAGMLLKGNKEGGFFIMIGRKKL